MSNSRVALRIVVDVGESWNRLCAQQDHPMVGEFESMPWLGDGELAGCCACGMMVYYETAS
jgi:hypothetical protein